MNRPTASKLQTFAVAAAGVGLIVAVLFAFAPKGRDAKKGEPNIDALKPVLERSAEEVLPLPTVASMEIVLDVPSARRDREIERIVTVATDLGGTALRSESAEGSLEVLAQIPAGNVAAFHAQVTGDDVPAEPTTTPDDGPTEFVVVKFGRRPAATPAPSAGSSR